MILATSENGDEELATWGQQDKLLQLLNSSSYIEREYELLKAEIEDRMSADRYEELYYLLIQRQLDPITSGRNYDMGDINRKIKKEIL